MSAKHQKNNDTKIDTVVFNFHGWGSVGGLDKINDLRQQLPASYRVVSMDYSYHNPLLVLDEVKQDLDYLPTTADIVFVGSSTGAWWANYFAKKYGRIVVLINPLVTVEPLKKFIGVGENYYTHEKYEFTDQAYNVYCALEHYCNSNNYFVRTPTGLLTCSDDGDLDYQRGVSNILYGTDNGPNITKVFTGGHRWFDAEEIAKMIITLQNEYGYQDIFCSD